MWIGGRRTTAGGRLDCNETGRRGVQGSTAAVLRPDAVRPQDRRGRPHHRFRRGLSRDHRAGGERGRARPDPRRRGEDRRRHPQADVRAADALQLRDRRHHRRQSQRLLRARHPPRDAAALDRDPVRGGHHPAVRHRAAARHSLPDQRAGRAVQCRRLLGAIARQLGAAKENPHDDSPLFQLLDYMPRHEVDHTKTDTFRDRFNYSKQFKERLADALPARRAGGQGNDRRSRIQEPARPRDRRGRRHVPDPARREGAQGDDRPVSAHARAAAARPHRARAVWLRAQPRGQGAGGDRPCSRR